MRLARCVLGGAAALLLAGTASAAMPNRSYTSDQLYQRISPELSATHHNQPMVINGHLLLAGNAEHELWDISDPFKPLQLSTFASPHHDGEAESHQVSFRKTKDDRYLAVLISGKGVDLWDLTDVENPALLSHMDLEGIDYGDNTNAVWGVFWQGDYIFVGGTNTGLHIVDASDPTQPALVRNMPTTELGGVSAGPLFAVGNLLVVTTPKEHAGIATLDIGDPANPALLDFELPETKSYIGWMFKGNLHLLTPFRTYDVTTDPSDIQLIGSDETAPSEYMSFADDTLFLGALRPEGGNYKIDISDPNDLEELAFIEGRRDQEIFGGTFIDDQFSIPIGNLLVMSDDEQNIGSVLAVHALERDTRPPEVGYINPPNGSTMQPLTTRVGISFDDQIDLNSVDAGSLIVRPVGGEPIAGSWGHMQTIVTFWPDAPLLPNTTYEVVLPAGGISDLVGNTLAQEFVSVFATGDNVVAPTCAIAELPPVMQGEATSLASADTTSTAYAWDFGDGNTAPSSAETTVSHTFSEPGRYPVRLTVEQDGVSRTCTAVQVVHRPLTSARATRSSSVIVDNSRQRVFSVNPDANTVTVVDATDLSVIAEVAVGEDPKSLAQGPDGRVWVACHESDELHVLNPDTAEVDMTIALRWGGHPFGVAFSPDGSSAWVSLQASGQVLKLDPASGEVLGTIELGPDADGLVPQVRGLAVSPDSSRVLVTRFISSKTHGEVYEIDAASGSVLSSHALAEDPGPDAEDAGRGVPNYLSSITISPDGLRAVVPGKKDNTSRGLVRDGQALNTDNTVRTLISSLELEPATGTPQGELMAARVDINDHDMAFAAEFSPLGDLLFVVSQGTNQLDVYDAYGGRLVGGASTGLAPQGLALSADGKLFVQSFMSRRLDVYDASAILSGASAALSPLGQVSTVENELLSAQELLGKQIFYNADSRQMSQDGYVSCASCHLDGGQDGRVWDFTDRGEGLRNTITLEGRAGTAHGPVHWTANFDEIQDFENDIRAHFGGSGFLADEHFDEADRSDPLGAEKAGLSEQLDALAAYVSSLDSFGRSPYRQSDGSLTEAGQRGQELFNGLDCRSCHAGQTLTDSGTELHDVGTQTDASGQRRGEALTGLDTPTLRGLWSTAPYLHDGSAATLRAVLDNAEHGNASELSDAEKDDLAAYLLQIEDEELEEWTEPEPGPQASSGGSGDGGGCGCRTTKKSTPAGVAWLGLIGLMLWRRRVRPGA